MEEKEIEVGEVTGTEAVADIASETVTSTADVE